MGYIYKISNSVNNKVYIGQTINNPEIRWNSHRKNIKNTTINRPLVDSMRILGIDKFRFEVLVICFDESLDDMEIEYIKRYNSLHPNGYNYTEGGHFHKRPSEELRKKLSMIAKKRYEQESERQRNREAQRLAFSDPVLRQKMADARSTLLKSKEGDKWREEHSKNIRTFWNSEEGQKKKMECSNNRKEKLKTPEGIKLCKEHSNKMKMRNMTEEGKKSIKQMSETKKAFFATEDGKMMLKMIQEKRKKTLEEKKKMLVPKVYRCDACDYTAPNNNKLQRHNSTKSHNDKVLLDK